MKFLQRLKISTENFTKIKKYKFLYVEIKTKISNIYKKSFT